MKFCIQLPQCTLFKTALIKLCKKLSGKHISTKTTFPYKMEKMGQIAINLMTHDNWNAMIWHAKKHKVNFVQLKTACPSCHHHCQLHLQTHQPCLHMNAPRSCPCPWGSCPW